MKHFLDQFTFSLFFLNCYLAAPRPILDHYWGDNLTHPMLITAFFIFDPKGHRESRNEVGSLSLAECLVGFELGSFQFLLRLNPLGHFPQKQSNSQPCRRKRSNCFIMPPRTMNLFSTWNNQAKRSIAITKHKMLH